MESKEQNMALGVLAYLGPLVIVSYFVGKDNSFVKFHTKQGMILFIGEVILWILGTILMSLWMLFNLVNLAIFVLAVIGIINVVQGKEDKLPVIGDFAKNFKF